MSKKIALLLLGLVGCVEEPDVGDLADESSEIRDTSHPVQFGNMTGIVKVETASGGNCSGSAISADTVITAAHCGNNGEAAWVSFQPPMAPGSSPIKISDPDPVTSTDPQPRKVRGTLYRHPSYSGCWTCGNFFDIAVVKLQAGAPVHAAPFVVGGTPVAVNRTVKIAGFGKSGIDCTGPSLTLHWDDSVLSRWNVVGNQIHRYDLDILGACDGDSGGPLFGDPVLNPYIVDGVFSAKWTFLQSSDIYIPTATHYTWIKNHVCPVLPRNTLTSVVGDLCHYTASNRILWRHTSGSTAIWTVSDDGVIQQEPSFAANADEKIQGTGDFDHDGDADVVLRHTNGQIKIWYMNGNSIQSSVWSGGQDPSWWWKVAGIGDFDGDGDADILWRDEGTPAGSGTGRLALWYRGRTSTIAYPSWYNQGGTTSLDWRVTGIGDFNKDGKADIFWQHTSGQTAIWLMNGGTMWGEWLPGPATGKTFKGVGDFNGDGASDVIWMGADRKLEIWFSGGGQRGDNVIHTTSTGRNITEADEKQLEGPSYYNAYSGLEPAPVSAGHDIVGVGDFNHDGRDDLLWQSGNYYSVWLLDGVRNYVSFPLRGANETARYVPTGWAVKGLMRNN